MADLGPPERLARGEVRVEGEGQHRRGRVLDVIATFGRDEQEAAAWLDQLFEASEWPGFKCSRFDRGAGGSLPGSQTERATHARRQLFHVSGMIGPIHWDIIFHVLFFMEPQQLYAIRRGIRKSEVRPRLRTALFAVANYRRQGH